MSRKFLGYALSLFVMFALVAFVAQAQNEQDQNQPANNQQQMQPQGSQGQYGTQGQQPSTGEQPQAGMQTGQETGTPMTGKKTKLSGCLIQGMNPNEFQLRAANGRTYMLVPEGNVDFSSHLNHKVTVSGTRETAASAGMGAEGTAGARGAAGTQEQIRVSSISHIGKTCK